MAGRRRRRTRMKAVRRFLLEHRFNAAEGVLGVLAMVAGLWLLWPSDDGGTVQLRDQWQESLLEARRSPLETPGGPGAGMIRLAAASAAVSAKRELHPGFGVASVSIADRRLARIREIMPEIGPLDADVPLPADILLPKPPAGDASPPAAEEEPDRWPAGEELGPQLAGLVAPRLPPEFTSGPEWLRYAARAPVETGQPKIAIVIDDLGMNRRNTAALNQMKGPLTLAFLPYADDLTAQTSAARAAGHELLMHMPMEPTTQDWPGPGALLTSQGDEELTARLRKNFAAFQGMVGINNHMGSRLTADSHRMSLVMAELRARDLLFLDSKTTAASTGVREARRHGVPFAVRDVFLDNVAEFGPIMRQLRHVEQVARHQGVAIAIGHPHDMTLQALRRWLPEVTRRGFQIVPISTVVALRTCRQEPLLAGCRTYTPPEPVRALAAEVEAQQS